MHTDRFRAIRGVAVISALTLVVAIQWVAPSMSSAQTTSPEKYPTASDHPDESSSFDLLLAWQAGAGRDTSAERFPTAYAGVKIGFDCCNSGKHPNENGRTVTLDLGYDRLQRGNGFSAELSTLLPIVRFPRPANEAQNYLRIYAGPGGGFRMGGGPSGPFVSAIVAMAFLSDRRIYAFKGSPLVQLEHRLPIGSARYGDTRLTAGMMLALCRHCGLD